MKRTILILAMILTSYISASAETSQHKTYFAYDVNYEMRFDNREFYKSRFSKSMTIFGSRLTPSAGIQIVQRDRTTHRIMTGIDIMKDFGASPVAPSVTVPESPELSSSLNNKDLFKELTLWYGMKKADRQQSFELYAGIFPRRFMEGRYSQAFFSDSLAFYDNNLEGMLIRYKKRGTFFELGCDWMGKYGDSRREKFMIFSSGEKKMGSMMYLGYSAYMYHFACSREVVGVVDNMLINPYLRFDFSRPFEVDNFTITVGWLQSFQHDRLNVGHYVFPNGAEVVTDLSNWNFGLKNHLFYGTDMMPYYNSKDIGGYKYGSRLYVGDPFFRVFDDGTTGYGIYDRLEVYYTPRLGKLLDLKVSALFHFNKGYSGCQQVVSLLFNLQEIVK